MAASAQERDPAFLRGGAVVLEIKHLKAGYGRAAFLSVPSFTFPKGQITGIIGPNGCGKTTLLKSAARLLRPLDGQVLLEGRDIWDMEPKAFARQVSLLPQTRTPYSMKVESLVSHGRFPYLGFSRSLSPGDREKVEEAMELTGVLPWRGRSVLELSGGERQRVYLAMTVAQDTPILLLDEPATYLDISCQLELLELLQMLNRRGKTIVMILHDLPQALRYCHSLCLMQEGSLLFSGTPEEVYQSGLLDQVFGVRCLRRDVPGEEPVYFFRPAAGEKEG